jgi:hypothetical protein
MLNPNALPLTDDEATALADPVTLAELERFATTWDANAALTRSIATACNFGRQGRSRPTRDRHIRRALAVYDALQGEQRQSLRELQDRCGLRSTSTVSHLLDTLERAGLIARERRHARSISLRTNA